MGEVQNSDIFFDEASASSKVGVKVWVKKDARIPVDSQSWINTLGLLGEINFLEIMPGKDYQSLVEGKLGIAGSDPVPMVMRLPKKPKISFADRRGGQRPEHYAGPSPVRRRHPGKFFCDEDGLQKP